jgi:hypothetical protein
MASGLSKAMQSTMSWPLLRFAPSEPCQVSPAVEKQDLVVAALGAHALDHGRQPVEAPDAAVGFGERLEALIGQRIGRGLISPGYRSV